MRDLVEARMLQPFRVAEPGVDEKTISAPSRKARGTTTHPQSSVNKSPDYPKPPQSLLFRLWRIIKATDSFSFLSKTNGRPLHTTPHTEWGRLYVC